MPIRSFSAFLDVGRAHPLAYTNYLPEHTPAKVMLISSATAVHQKFYKRFATFFATHGFAVYTFDYSGFGASGNTKRLLKNHEGGLKGWGAIDQRALVLHLQEEHPGLDVVLVCHSIGGQITGFNPENHAFKKVIMIASQSGYWKIYDGWNRLRLWLFWYFFIPVFTPIFGYYPGKVLGVVDNLPKGMVLEWRKWGTKKDYLMHYHNKNEYFFDQLSANLQSFSFTNDSFASKQGVDWLADQYTNVKAERIHFDQNESAKKPGHFGFFKEEFKEDFWVPALHAAAR